MDFFQWMGVAGIVGVFVAMVVVALMEPPDLSPCGWCGRSPDQGHVDRCPRA